MKLKRDVRFGLVAASTTLAALIVVACGGGGESESVVAPVTVAPVVPVVLQVPIVDSWQLKFSGRYARSVETRDSFPVRTWPAAGLTDTSGAAPLPTYSDVQLVRESATDVYISTSGLASHPMGPWYWNVNTLFGNWPRAQAVVYRLPKTPVETAEDRKSVV